MPELGRRHPGFHAIRENLMKRLPPQAHVEAQRTEEIRKSNIAARHAKPGRNRPAPGNEVKKDAE